MRKLLLLLAIVFSASLLKAQKPCLDINVLGKWPKVSNPKINNNGAFICYNIDNQPVGSTTLIVKSLNGEWERKFVGISEGLFLDDDLRFIFQKGDSLFILDLGKDKQSVLFASLYRLPKYNKKKWLAYKVSSTSSDIMLRDLTTGNERVFNNVIDFAFNDSGSVLLLKGKAKPNCIECTTLQWVQLGEGNVNSFSVKEIFSGFSISGYNFNIQGNKIVFVENKANGGYVMRSIWVYTSVSNEVIKCASDSNLPLSSDLKIGNRIPKFAANDSLILFYLNNISNKNALPKHDVLVDVWHYQDKVIQSAQLNNLKDSENKEYAAQVSIGGNRLIRLVQDDEFICGSSSNAKYFILRDNNSVQYPWQNEYSKKSYFLINIRSGERKWLKKDDYSMPVFSPQSKYVVWFDRNLKNYFSYDIRVGILRNISKFVNARLDNEYEVYNQPEVGIAGWLMDDNAILVYDNYDIWKLDPKGIERPVNITNYYGKRNNIKLRLIYDNVDFSNKDVVLSQNDSIVLVAFNVTNKLNGFCQKVLSESGNPKSLFLGPYTFYRKMSQKQHFYSFGDDFKPIKAKNDDIWIVQRQSSTEAPNLFFTRDFKRFIPISNLQPQNKFNWLTTELIKWKQFDGTTCAGILYKPEDFDSSKKYPIIFNYYEQLSHRLYEFPEPEFTKDNINIPWFVSQGYLVFTPDIHFSLASISNKTNGENAYNSIVSAAKYFSRISWIDKNRMGIQGHSFGGGITNYLITHTQIFAAAAEAAGVSDIVSSYLRLTGPLGSPDNTIMYGQEYQQGRSGANLWQRPDLYLKGSPILNAHKVKTPLLIMHNKADGAVPWMQGVEMFLALQRLGKKVWMLQYDGGTHSVYGKNAVDYTIRLTQFFNHYLRGLPAPAWLKEGIPACRKGVDMGYGGQNILPISEF